MINENRLLRDFFNLSSFYEILKRVLLSHFKFLLTSQKFPGSFIPGISGHLLFPRALEGSAHLSGLSTQHPSLDRLFSACQRSSIVFHRYHQLTLQNLPDKKSFRQRKGPKKMVQTKTAKRDKKLPSSETDR